MPDQPSQPILPPYWRHFNPDVPGAKPFVFYGDAPGCNECPHCTPLSGPGVQPSYLRHLLLEPDEQRLRDDVSRLMTFPDRPTPEYPLVLVEWEDAANIGGWTETEDAAAFEDPEFDYHCQSAGFLIRDDDECVVVASRATGDFKAVGLFERIPRGVVKRVVNLRRED